MSRVFILYVAVTVLEFIAFWVYREHPIIRPDYWNTLLLVAQLGMCWGGVEAARWLLRRSPVAGLPGPTSEWTKLWLWAGPPGGLLLGVACLLGMLADQATSSKLAGPVVVAHLSGGAVLWVIASFWAAPDLLRDPESGHLERMLLNLGISSHILGLIVYFTIYPAQSVPFVSLLVTVFFFYFLLYYVMLTMMCWALVFRVWKPANPVPHEAVELELEVSEPTRYLNEDDA